MLRNFSYYFTQLWENISRNFLMSTAAISTSFFSQLIFGCLILVIFNINHISNQIWSQVEVRAYLDHAVQKETVYSMAEQIEKSKPQVRGAIQVVSPNRALQDLEKELNMSLWDRDEENPLPWTLIIRVHHPDQIQQIVDYLVQEMNFKKEDLRYPEEVVQKINTISIIIKISGYVMTILMAGLTLFIIMNTIRLTVVARRTEIRTMQLVGATSWFIRWPFLLEGIMIGITGSIISWILLSIGYWIGFRGYMKLLFFLPTPIGLFPMLKTLLFILGLCGFCMGLAGSYISVRRFLEEEV